MKIEIRLFVQGFTSNHNVKNIDNVIRKIQDITKIKNKEWTVPLEAATLALIVENSDIKYELYDRNELIALTHITNPEFKMAEDMIISHLVREGLAITSDSLRTEFIKAIMALNEKQSELDEKQKQLDNLTAETGILRNSIKHQHQTLGRLGNLYMIDMDKNIKCGNGNHLLWINKSW